MFHVASNHMPSAVCATLIWQLHLVTRCCTLLLPVCKIAPGCSMAATQSYAVFVPFLHVPV